MSIPPDIDNAVDELADLFHLLGDPTRLRIVLACLAQPTAVGDIAGALNLSSSLVKEVATYGGDVADMLPAHVHARLIERIAERKAAG